MAHLRGRWDAYDLLPERIAVFDAHGRRLYTNPAWSRAMPHAGCPILGVDHLAEVSPSVDAGGPGGQQPTTPDAQLSADIGRLVARQTDSFERDCSCGGSAESVACRIRASSHQTGAKRVLVLVQEDLSEQRRVEQALRRVVADRETLLREVHHRVKNNLQIISSLLAMQLRTLDTDAARRAIRETRMRVRTIAAVHERLCESADLARLDLGEYIRTLVPAVFSSFAPSSTKLDLVIEADSVSVGLDDAVRCGLIVNELVSNALKHAFVGRPAGRLLVRLERAGELRAALTVSDDGVGLPESVNPLQGDGLGLHLATGLAQRMGGQLDLERDQGTTFRVFFRIPTLAVEAAPVAVGSLT
jgi:two-component sensor histidine kinase